MPEIKLDHQTRFWLITLALLGALLWLFKAVLLPFVAGVALAYFAEPAVSLMQRRRVPRWLGATLVLTLMGVGLVVLGMLILPLIIDQLTALVDAVPDYIEKIRTQYLPWLQRWVGRIPGGDVDQLRAAAGQSAASAAGWVGDFARGVLSSGAQMLNAITSAIIVPIVAFFALRDWPLMVRVIDGLWPRRYVDVIQTQLAAIDETLSGFLRGQALVCVALGFIYSIGLTLTGLHYSLAIGVTSGVLSFIPYVGTGFGWVTSLLLALGQFDDWTRIAMVMAVFVIGNILEGYILTPRLVGKRVGLHAVWIMFALIAGAKLMGFLGVLIAVPTAAVLGVMIRFFAQQYKRGNAYRDSF